MDPVLVHLESAVSLRSIDNPLTLYSSNPQKSCSSDSIAENNSYFISSGISLGSNCRLTVCKCASTVCQLRLDFETFALNLVRICHIAK